MQRKLRSQNGGELPKEEFNTFPAEFVQDNKVFKIKIRTKGFDQFIGKIGIRHHIKLTC